MLQKILPAPVIGAFSLTLHTINTLWVFIPFLPLAILKFLIPVAWWQTRIDRLLTLIAESWIHTNNGITKLTKKVDIQVSGDLNLKRKDWYLVISNHVSWADIFLIQQLLVGKIPFLKFFLKDQLKWFPVLGICWWALDFPFMKRHTKSQIRKNPALKGKDIETTKRACEKFKHKPISVMNFVEGTRFTEAKHKRQNSPFENLLKPKAGGIGYVMAIMGEQMHKIVDITIVYKEPQNGFWDYLCGRVTQVKIDVQVLDVTPDIVGDYINDGQFRSNFQQWLNQIWTEKDQKIHRMKSDI